MNATRKLPFFAAGILSVALFALPMQVAGQVVESGVSWSMDIVDELDALSKLGTQTNPWTATQGGTWGFYEGDASTLGEAWPYTKTSAGLVGFFDKTRLYCCFLANPSTSSKSAPSDIGVSVGGRKVLYHPKSGSTVETLRYVVESAGVYSVTGAVRTALSSSNGITADVVVNGVWCGGVTSTTSVVTFAVTNRTVWAGETIDLRLTANGAHSFDATELSYVLMREGDVPLPIVQTASEALDAATKTANVVNPVVRCGGRPGTWGFYRRMSSGDAAVSSRIDYSEATQTPIGWLTLHASGIGVASGTDQYPYLLVNMNLYPMKTPSSSAIDPGEMSFAPEYSMIQPFVIRYTADYTGHYSFAVAARDTGAESGNGVNVAVWRATADGQPAAVLMRQLLEPRGSVELEGTDVVMRAGESIELVLDSNGNHSYDATGLRFSVTLDEKVPGLGAYWATPAMRANCTGDVPTATDYVDAQGGKWSFGYADESTMAFTPFATAKTNGTFRGWTAAQYLTLMVNSVNVEAQCSEQGIGIVTGDEMAVHPDSKKAATARFKAPSDGLYRVDGHVRALNANGGDGVEGRVVVRENGFAVQGLAAAKASVGLPSRVDLSVDGLWLKADETVDLSLGPGLSNNISFDASAMSWTVTRLGDLPTTPHVSFDICGTVREPIDGAGRIGFAADGAWVPVRTGAKRSVLGPIVGGARRAVRLVLSKAAASTALASVATVVSDGVTSAGVDDPVAFALTGLTPGATYSLWAYSRNASGVCGVFEVGGTVAVADKTWFCHVGGDSCTFTATADANGEIAGVFRGTADGAATFCALQVMGETFPEYEPKGMTLIVR